MVDFPTDVSATDPDVLLGANATDPAKVLISATGRTLIAGTDASAMRTTLGLGSAAVAATTDFDAAGAAVAAQGAAIIAASNDATSKANTAQANAIAAAALDATSKANTAEADATAAAALDATSKANAAAAAAILASAQRASNLSDLASAPAARDNLNISGSLSAGGLTIPTTSVGPTGLLTVGLMQANLNSAPDFTGQIRSFQIAALTNFQLTANVYYYVTVAYNGGTPVYEVITDNTIINHADRIAVCNVIWEVVGVINEAHVFHVGDYGLGLVNKIGHRLVHTDRFAWQDGLILGEAGGRVVTISAGTVWYDGYEINLGAVSSSTQVIHQYHHSAPNVWTATHVGVYNNLSYDNNTGGLQTLGNGDFAVNWVYRGVSQTDPALYVVLGTSSYTTLTAAAAAQPPASLPTVISKQALLVGRIICLKNAVTASQIDSSFTISFAPTGTIAHNDTVSRDVAGAHPHSAISMATRTITDNAVITLADYYVRYAGPAGKTLTIPAANVAGAGFTAQFFFRNVSNAAVSITDGVTTVSLLPGQKALFMSDGVSTWDVN